MRHGTWQSSGRLHSLTGGTSGFSSSSSKRHHHRYVLNSDAVIQYFTVCMYIFFVSMPAIALGVYYVCIWEPNYLHKDLTHASAPNNLAPNLTATSALRQPIISQQSKQAPRCDCSACPAKKPRDTVPKINLQSILVTSTSVKPG